MTYGLKRAEPLSAAINGAVLGVLAIVFVIEAISRLAHPHDVDAVLVAGRGARRDPGQRRGGARARAGEPHSR